MFQQGGDSSSLHDDHSLQLDSALSDSIYEAADFLLRETAPLLKDDSPERRCNTCMGTSCVCAAASDVSQMPSTSSAFNTCQVCNGETNLPALRMAHEIVCTAMSFCHQCCVTFPSGLAKELHMVREHSSLPCVGCGESFSSELKLSNHLAREHSSFRCPCCDEMVSENLENHLTSIHKSNTLKHPFLRRPDFTCCLCVEKFNTSEVSSIVIHLLEVHNVKQERVLLFLSKLDADSDDDDLNNDILVPLVNLFASSESSSEEDECEQFEENFGIDLLDVDPEDVDCVSESSYDGDEGDDDSHLECELCEEKHFVSPRELCFHMNEEHQLGWDKKSESDCKTAEYSCYLCTYKCRGKRQLKTHLKDDHTHLGNKCRFCPVRFKEHRDRDKHQLEQHPDQQNIYQCPVCQFVSTSTAISQQHLSLSHPAEKMKSKVKYKCKICHQLMPSILLMRSHFSSWHLGAMIYRCRLCSATLKTKKTLNHHVKVVHSEFKKRDCSICNKEFPNKRAYTSHFRMKHNKSSKVGFSCRLCQRKFDTKEDRKLHYTLDHEGESPYHCEDCGKGFASKSGMYGHRQLHTGTGISKCEYCGKEFTRKDSYNEHLLIHNGPRHKCPHCPKEFVQRSNLIRHIRIHTGEKPYQCTYCDKKFSDKGACNSHIRVHTKEESCSCPYCGQTFSKKQKLKYHIRKHTGEGLIECEICNKMFTNSFALKEHRIIHNRQTQVVCPQCGKGFNSEKYLQRHVAIVHEPTDKSFQCSICPKKFSQQARLRAHVMTHSGVKHMKCLLCDKAYSVRKSLRRHLLEKHQIGPDNPQYRQSFHTMSPEEAGMNVNEGEVGMPSDSTSGRKRRRVEQIVQNLQNSLSSSQQTARIAPLVINLNTRMVHRQETDGEASGSSTS